MTPRDFLVLLRRILRPQAVLREGQTFLYPVPPDATFERTKAGLAAFDAAGAMNGPSELDDEAPIFVCGVGWRVGSTLLQRICCTDPSLILWGEPLGNMGLISRITEAICIAQPGSWPFREMWLNPQDVSVDRAKLHRDFVANLYPPAEHFRASFQHWLHRWLGEPARALGFRRWGLKATRISASDALFLRWLFPRAVFLPIIRHPIAAYRSLKAAEGDLWIEPRTQRADLFAAHWNRLAISWIKARGQLPFTMVRFEDLAAGRVDTSALTRETGLKLEPEKALAVRSGGSSARGGQLARETEALICRVARNGMREYGYGSGAPVRPTVESPMAQPTA
jgi:hypothetical protein